MVAQFAEVMARCGHIVDELVSEASEGMSNLSVEAVSSSSASLSPQAASSNNETSNHGKVLDSQLSKNTAVVALGNVNSAGIGLNAGSLGDAEKAKLLVITSSKAGLLTIPRELRDAIYEATLQSHGKLLYVEDKELFVQHERLDLHKFVNTDLLQTCSMIYFEALQVFYACNSFKMYTFYGKDDIYIRTIMPRPFLAHVRDIQLYFDLNDAPVKEPDLSPRPRDMVLQFLPALNTWAFQEPEEMMDARWREANHAVEKVWRSKARILAEMVIGGSLERLRVTFGQCIWGYDGPCAISDVMEMIREEIFKEGNAKRKCKKDLRVIVHYDPRMRPTNQPIEWVGTCESQDGWNMVTTEHPYSWSDASSKMLNTTVQELS